MKEKWKTSFAEICKFIDSNNNEYFEKCWEKRIEILGKYPQYYQPYRMIPLVFKSDTTCEMKMIQTFLEKVYKLYEYLEANLVSFYLS